MLIALRQYASSGTGRLASSPVSARVSAKWNQSRHNEGCHSASHSAMLGLDYSSSDEDNDDTKKVQAPTVAAEADKRGGKLERRR